MKMIQKFRTIYQAAIDNGWVQNTPFASIKIHFDIVDRGFISKPELVAIIQKTMTSKRLGHRNIRTTQIYVKVIHDKVAADIDVLTA